MKNELKLWKEYQEWVNKQNKPLIDWWFEMEDKNLKRYKRQNKKYEVNLKNWKKLRDKKVKNHQKWENLPWYKKWGTEEPKFLSEYSRPFPPIMPMSFPLVPLVTSSYENFLDWCVKKQ